MLIPLTYSEQHAEIAAEMSEICALVHNRPHQWKKYQPYGLEYSWLANQAIEHIGDLKSKHIIDAGGGTGAIQHYFARRHAQVYNISKPLYESAQSHKVKTTIPCVQQKGKTLKLPNISIIPHDMAIIELEPNFYDGVLCASSIEHNPWPHIIKCALNLIGSLKPGAPLVATVPAGKVRAWHPDTPVKKLLRNVYLFDSAALRELTIALKPYAELVTPLPSVDQYKQIWTNMHNILTSTPGTIRYPYLSAGFTFIKK